MKHLALALLFLLSPGCKVLLSLVRPFTASAIRGQDPTPVSEAKRAHFVSQAQLLDDVTYLSAPDCDGRASGTPGNALAREYIKKRLAASGLVVQEQDFPLKQTDKKTGAKTVVRGVNVLGILPGTNPQAPWIVVSAHYDHLGRSQKKGDYYPGADDNAAGVAALFALAEYSAQHPPSHPTLFVAFDAEELGSIGAAYFITKNTTVPKEDIAFNLNLDMISRSKKQELFAVTHNTPDQEPLREMLFALQSEVGYRLMVSVDDKSIRSLASDHLFFSMRDIPFLYLGVADHEDYHRVSDKVSRLDPAFYTAVVDSCVLLMQRLDAHLPQVKMPRPEGQ